VTRGARELLPAHPSSVAAARKAIRAWLAVVGCEALTEDAELAVSELVTNALVHAGTPVDMVARVDVGFVRIEVGDGSVHLPRVRDYVATAATGRGLKLLDHTVDRWGAHRRARGKVVWFELNSEGRDRPAPPLDRPDVPPTSASSVAVELLNLPLLLHAAWLEHAEALLREHLLVRLDSPDPETALSVHAAAGEALNLLAEQVPTPEVEDDPDVLMAGAVEPYVSMERLVLLVPRASVAHFAALDTALDDALALASAGLLLTPPAQPEVQALRRWLASEVVRQTAGDAAKPWSSLFDPGAAPEVPQIDWPRSSVDDSPLPLLAADDANRIVAISPAALAHLGYTDRGELVGRRLVALIPARFHQAHLAGFTLHLSNGRSPLLGRPVTVPVVRRDGTERLTELTVTAEGLADGRKVFIAQLRPPG
jgi:PAS domain S-box-containing protein